MGECMQLVTRTKESTEVLERHRMLKLPMLKAAIDYFVTFLSSYWTTPDI